jgi:NAD(P)-dependent dehydrogenase (short-subunit alcohol dehydrogenase family)
MALALDANQASKVFIIGRRESALLETASRALNGSIVPVVGDVSSKESLQGALDTISAQTEYIDLLVANAGILGPTNIVPFSTPTPPSLSEYREALWQIPMEEMTNTFHVNVTGAYYTAVAFLGLLDAANKRRPAPVSGELSPPRPQIIFTSSIGGFMRKISTGYAYQTSKAAVTTLTKVLSTTLLGYDVRVNGIAPGIYPSDMTESAFQASGTTGLGVTEGDFPRELIPLTRAGAEEDIGGLLVFMAGASGGYLNGSIIVTDGGRIANLPASY